MSRTSGAPLLVTGAAGFVGGRFAAACLAEGMPIVAVDRATHFRTRPELAGVPFSQVVDRDELLSWLMYAELSDFFYVWLKRTAGLVFPELFRTRLTDKEHEAVANAAKFKGQDHPRERADRDYRERMAAIFMECRRVLKPDGVLTLMFTHKATGAWDALAAGLIEAGFTVTASWPINTEAEGSLHIKELPRSGDRMCHTRTLQQACWMIGLTGTRLC